MLSVTAKARSARWASNLLKTEFYVLDTETTGLDRSAELCEIAIISSAGHIVMNTRVHPTRPIPPDATRIHGITNSDVSAAPGFHMLIGVVQELFTTKPVVIYNADYDYRIIQQSAAAHGFNTDWMHGANISCAMLNYAAFFGDWDDYRDSFAWQKLENACIQQGIPAPDAPAHSALGDCLRTLALIRKMAEWE
jgi:DNA polymerase III epsilon subunit-like protein